MNPEADKAAIDYAAAVTARQQGESAVGAAAQALNDANAQLDALRLAEEVAMVNLAVAAGIPAEKITVSAQAKATMAEDSAKADASANPAASIKV